MPEWTRVRGVQAQHTDARARRSCASMLGTLLARGPVLTPLLAIQPRDALPTIMHVRFFNQSGVLVKGRAPYPSRIDP
jgi:hypothetical protein